MIRFHVTQKPLQQHGSCGPHRNAFHGIGPSQAPQFDSQAMVRFAMTDITDSQRRSETMTGTKSRGTRYEPVVRRTAHKI